MKNRFEGQRKNTGKKKESSAPKKKQSSKNDASSDKYGPLAHLDFPKGKGHHAFGGEMQPGMFGSVKDRKVANPAPLGLCGVAFSTFIVSLINVGTLDLKNFSVLVCIGFV